MEHTVPRVDDTDRYHLDTVEEDKQKLLDRQYEDKIEDETQNKKEPGEKTKANQTHHFLSNKMTMIMPRLKFSPSVSFSYL